MADIPAAMQADIWREIAKQQELDTDHELDGIWDVTNEPLIAVERDRYINDLLSIDEFELRVETILAGGTRWWER